MEFLTKRNKRGFTLIELLVVIAIIGILASIVLVSVSGAQKRAKDARVTASMDQFRTQATLIADSNGGSFNNVYCSAIGATCTCLDTSVDTLCEDIAANASGTTMTIRIESTASTTYCAFARLQGSGAYRCVDSTLVSKEYTATTTMCNSGDYTCD